MPGDVRAPAGPLRDDAMAPVRRQPPEQAGFAMAALLVSLAVMSVLLSVALPVWNHAAKRERETELIFRGEQYARAVMLYQRQLPGAYPPDLDTLVEQRFLRRKYLDPMTEDGEFRLILQSEASALSGPGGEPEDAPEDPEDATAGLRPFSAAGNPGGFPDGVPFGSRDEQRSGGVDGNIVGVVSRSTDTSIAFYKGRSKYSEWEFVPSAASPPGAGDAGGAADGDGLGQQFGSGPGLGPGGAGGGPGRSPPDAGLRGIGRSR